MKPIVLSIAGSDPCGGAGLQADLKAIEASGGHAATVVSAITVQNGRGVTAVYPVSPEAILEQIEAVRDEFSIAAVKIGLLPEAAGVEAVAESLERLGPPHLVVDPVIRAGGGDRLQQLDAICALRDRILPLADLVTPNAMEAEALAGVAVRSLADAERAGEVLLRLGVGAALVTSGHLENESERGTDLLCGPSGSTRIEGPWYPTADTHGGGCTYASAIATGLALGLPMLEAIRSARRLLAAAIAAARPLGRGPGAVAAIEAIRRDETTAGTT